MYLYISIQADIYIVYMHTSVYTAHMYTCMGISTYTHVHGHKHALYIPVCTRVRYAPWPRAKHLVYFILTSSGKRGWDILQEKKLRVGDIGQLPRATWLVRSRAGVGSSASSSLGPFAISWAMGRSPVLQATGRALAWIPFGVN